ncbi:MAG: CoA-binding protein, partial [Thermoproteota archaeon]
MDPRIRAFFEPNSVAVIGASRNPRKIGHIIVSQMLRAGFSGKLFPVNPKATEILGLKVYPSILEVPEEVDLAIISIPAQYTIHVIEECGKKGVSAAVVISGGFSEVGNRKLERGLVEVAKKWGIRLMGPNCMGVYSPPSKVDMLFTPDDVLPRAPKGNVAVLSQSGSLAAGLMTMLAKQEVGVSRFISYGNAADVDEADILEYLVEDNETRV